MFYDHLLRPALFRMDPERVHDRVLSILRRRSASRLLGLFVRAIEKPVELWGLTFRNPVGLAAGFDKNGCALDGWHALGFGFVEVGTVTRHAQPGNEKPRIFRIPECGALVNRMGFPNDGADVVAARLERYRARGRKERFPIAVNIGKSKITPLQEAEEDYLYSFDRHYEQADFFVINVSSPNTPGLRELQRPEQLRPILRSLKRRDAEREGKKPICVKIAPDLETDQITDILALIEETGVDGIVATNTTIDHAKIRLEEKGGLSGLPLRERSTEVIRHIHRETGGKLPILGVGGVFTRDDYQEKIDAGATLVEIYTGFVYNGPSTVASILE